MAKKKFYEYVFWEEDLDTLYSYESPLSSACQDLFLVNTDLFFSFQACQVLSPNHYLKDHGGKSEEKGIQAKKKKQTTKKSPSSKFIAQRRRNILISQEKKILVAKQLFGHRHLSVTDSLQKYNDREIPQVFSKSQLISYMHRHTQTLIYPLVLTGKQYTCNILLYFLLTVINISTLSMFPTYIFHS